jgi:branched-chain amino acid transport system substrate-binding protein
MSGVFSDISGPGAVEAVRMAAEDFGGRVLGAPIEVLVADHQNKADIASNTARQWFDTQGVDMAADLMNSAVALSVLDLAKTKNRVAIVNGASTSASPTRTAPSSVSTTPGTPTPSRTAPRAQWSGAAATAGSSSRLISPMATPSRRTPPTL